MLIAFRVRNFRSIRDEQELTLTRSGRMKAAAGDGPGPWDERVTSVAGFYGSNASGKSNLLLAMRAAKRAIVDSHAGWNPERDIPYTPYKFDASREEPTWYEFEFRVDGLRLQYGFEHDRRRFLREWLYAYPKGRRQTWYERDASGDEEWYFGKLLGGQNRVIAETTRPNALFLSAAASAHHPRLRAVYRWFSYHLIFAMESDRNSRLRYTLNLIESEPSMVAAVTSLLKHADLGICDVRVRHREMTDDERAKVTRVARAMFNELGPSDGASGGPDSDETAWAQALEAASTYVELAHACADGDPVSLPFEAESVGTQSLVALAGPVLEALRDGDTLVIDEIDTSLHPRLVAEVVKLFRSPATNPRQSQLLFTTHDTSLLGGLLGDGPILERDQIWFVEKNGKGATSLYPLTDFSPRRMENLERGYLQGRYGAVPYIEALNAQLRSSDADVEHRAMSGSA